MRSSSASCRTAVWRKDSRAAATSGTGVTGMIRATRCMTSSARACIRGSLSSLEASSAPGCGAAHPRIDNGVPKFTATRP